MGAVCSVIVCNHIVWVLGTVLLSVITLYGCGVHVLGKSIHHARGHAHRSDLVPAHELNFSHRIDRLAFSDEAVGVHTLDGNLRHTDDAHIMFQYFLKVVWPCVSCPVF